MVGVDGRYKTLMHASPESGIENVSSTAKTNVPISEGNYSQCLDNVT